MARDQRAHRIDQASTNIASNGHSTNGHALMGECVDQTKLLAALRRMRAGDSRVRLPLDWMGVPGNIAEVFNEIVELNQRLNREVGRISLTVSHEGKGDTGRRKTVSAPQYSP
jgi:hypothetical protein